MQKMSDTPAREANVRVSRKVPTPKTHSIVSRGTGPDASKRMPVPPELGPLDGSTIEMFIISNTSY